jgi:hypothetical protein
MLAHERDDLDTSERADGVPALPCHFAAGQGVNYHSSRCLLKENCKQGPIRAPLAATAKQLEQIESCLATNGRTIVVPGKLHPKAGCDHRAATQFEYLLQTPQRRTTSARSPRIRDRGRPSCRPPPGLSSRRRGANSGLRAGNRLL